MVKNSVTALENIDKEYEELCINTIIKQEFRQNPRWKHILERKSDVEHCNQVLTNSPQL